MPAKHLPSARVRDLLLIVLDYTYAANWIRFQCLEEAYISDFSILLDTKDYECDVSSVCKCEMARNKG